MQRDPLADRLAVIDTVTRVAVLADRRRWEELCGVFTEPVEVDYTALSGGQSEKLSPKELVFERWKPLLERFRATQHLLANHVIAFSGEEVVCQVDVRATHFSPQVDTEEAVWQVGGFYDYRLVRSQEGGAWLVRFMRFVPTWSRGNPKLSPTGAQVSG